MDVENKKIGFALTGSFCTLRKTIPYIKQLIDLNAEVIPIMSHNTYFLDTKFGKAKDFIKQIEQITHNKIIHTIVDSEPIGPNKMTDIMIIAPCTRKYNFKACFRYYRYTSYNGS